MRKLGVAVVLMFVVFSVSLACFACLTSAASSSTRTEFYVSEASDESFENVNAAEKSYSELWKYVLPIVIIILVVILVSIKRKRQRKKNARGFRRQSSRRVKISKTIRKKKRI